MAITKFVPELWSAAVQRPFEHTLVYGQPTVVNRKYEGEITQQGDTVHVATISDPTIREYDIATDLMEEDLADDELVMKIDQAQYFNFRVNDVEKVQAAGDFQGPAAHRAGFQMKDKVDTFIASLYGAAQDANKLGDLEITKDAPGDAYDVLVELSVRLDRASAPSDGRYAVVSPEFHGVLLRDDRFIRLDASGTTAGLRNGIVGRAAGFDILKSNNTPSTGTTFEVHAGIADAISLAVQITEMETLRSQRRFADLVRGLQVYGAKVFRPDGIATANVTITGGSNPGEGGGKNRVTKSVTGKV